MGTPEFRGVVPLLTPEVWLPMVHAEEVEPVGITNSVPGPGRTQLERRGTRWMFVKGRLKPGATVEQAQANVALIGRQLEAAHPRPTSGAAMSAIATSEVRMLVPQAGGVLTMGAAVSAIAGLFYGMTPFDPVAWTLAALTLLAAAAPANLIPARRAMRVNPMTALRTE